MKVMFICTGNICRSAMAEYLLRKKAMEKNRDIEVYSSGTNAANGDIPTDSGINVMKKRGIDITNHKATYIADSPINEMDLILCATNNHKRQVIMMYPNLKDKVYTMKEYVTGFPEDISDPWGYSEAVYEKCAQEIEECIDKLINKI